MAVEMLWTALRKTLAMAFELVASKLHILCFVDYPYVTISLLGEAVRIHSTF